MKTLKKSQDEQNIYYEFDINKTNYLLFTINLNGCWISLVGEFWLDHEHFLEQQKC